MSGVRAWLADRLLGPRCPLCFERFPGWRHVIKHRDTNHAGDPA